MFEDDIRRAVDEIKTKLVENKQTIATAESCTAGLVAYALTSVSGSSDYFKQGWVVYHPDSKHSELCLPRGMEIYSDSCAIHLAQASKAKAGADWAIGVTGKVEMGGRVDFAIAGPNNTFHRSFVADSDDRTRVRHNIVRAILDELWVAVTAKRSRIV